MLDSFDSVEGKVAGSDEALGSIKGEKFLE